MCVRFELGRIRSMWRGVRFAAMLFALVGAATPTVAQTEVDIELVFAVDASGSVNQHRFEMQKRGYVDALRNPKVLSAILGGRRQSIGVTLFQWTGPFLQADVLPWTILKDEASIASAASVIESTPRKLFSGGTSVSGAIDYSMGLFGQSPFKSDRRVIDISGDGSNNTGRSVVRARDQAVEQGATINGLPILAVEPYLDQYFRDYVIGGPGAFMIVAETFEAFADAILKKMIVEIASNDPPAPNAWKPQGLHRGVLMKGRRGS